ncbi:MAG: L-threonylcarbamoyladenylate synthase [Actinomycetota bacterium]
MTASDADIDHAVEVLRRGGLVGMPTETVYGLAADASSDAAIRRIYEAKGRPSGHPVIVHVGAADLIDGWAVDVPPAARRLGEALWPGPLTLVLPRGPLASPLVSGGRDSVGIRVPDHPVALAVLERFAGAVGAPSANRFGRVSPTTAADVVDDLGDRVDVVLDGGASVVGVESTIVSFVGAPTLLRPGGVPVELIESILGGPLASAAADDRSAPGTLPSHYAPDARVELVEADEVADRCRTLLGTGSSVGALVRDDVEVPDAVVRLSSSVDEAEAARTLYARLREADRLGLDVLVAARPDLTGLGRAIADRLRRAAHRDR